MRQQRVAARYFTVPDWKVTLGVQPAGLREPAVVKTLAQAAIGGDRILFVQEVQLARLDPRFPWFVQEKAPADEDVTVAWVNGRIFAFSLRRDSFSGDDCRREGVTKTLPWEPTQLTADQERAVRGFMAETGFSFGRLDFLRQGERLWFLELNPNGQFAWLDPEDRHGLLSAVADAIREVYLKTVVQG